jgi:hypothetical protein
MITGTGRNLLFIGAAVAILSGTVLINGCDKKPQGGKAETEKQATESVTKRVSFQELFEVNGATVTPKKTIRVGSTTMTPEVPFDIQVMMIEGAPFSQFVGRDAEIREANGLCEIVKFY